VADGYTVIVEQGALKALRRMDGQVRRLILAYIRSRLEGIADPRSIGKGLVGAGGDLWRYRVGDYRILAQIKDHEVAIYAFRIGHRREVYRDL
jgi:mRNA interferase RelE/StbE